MGFRWPHSHVGDGRADALFTNLFKRVLFLGDSDMYGYILDEEHHVLPFTLPVLCDCPKMLM